MNQQQREQTITLGYAPGGTRHIDAERAAQGWSALGTEAGNQAFTQNSDAVKSLQRQLIFLGYTTGPKDSSPALIDGNNGSGTTMGIHAFQKEHGLQVGPFDRATAMAMDQSVKQQLTAMSDTEVQERGKVLDRSLWNQADRYLLTQHGEAIQASAKAAAVDPAMLYALMRQESRGGADNNPRLERSQQRSLTKLSNYLQEHSEELQTLDPTSAGDKNKINQLYTEAKRHSGGVSGLLDSMTGTNPTPHNKLHAMQTFEKFIPGEIRELSTSWGYGQVLGYHTLEDSWQKASGKNGAQLLQDLQSSDPTTQINTVGSYVAHGEDSRGLSGGVASAMRGPNPYEATARAHNGGMWKKTNPHYANNLRTFKQEHNRHAAPERTAEARPAFLVPPLAVGGQLLAAHQMAYQAANQQIQQTLRFDLQVPLPVRAVELEQD